MYRKSRAVALFLLSLLTVGSLTFGQAFAAGEDSRFDALKRFSQVLDIVERYYVKETPRPDLVNGALKGMLESLDPHSTMLSKEEFKDMQESTSGEFFGIGIEITMENNQLTVVTPIEDTPADKGGMKSGDIILAVGGKPTLEMTLQEAVSHIRGPKGSEVVLTILHRDSKEPVDLRIKRDAIPLISVKSRELEPGYYWVRLTRFSERTTQELLDALSDAKRKGPIKGIILDLRNNPEEPKILCVGNNPDRQNIYGAALGLYNSRIVKLINRKKQLKSCVVIDELPTIYFRGLDNLIATARSNKVAVCLGFQDFSQLKRDYGDKEAAVIQNTVGNIFSGQVVGETARTLSERFGKIVQKRQSVSINRSDTSTSINTQLDSLIPASKISTLSQGVFVGAVSDNFGEEIEQKIFHARIVVDNDAVKKEMAEYKPIPAISSFLDADGRDIMQEKIKENYRRIKQDALDIIEAEMKRIEGE